MYTKPLLLLVLSVLLSAAGANLHAQIFHLAPEVKKAILKGPPDSVFEKVSEIPHGALKTLGFPLANPGEEYQVTDVIVEPNLPLRRLIWGAHKAGYLILHDESGGIGHGYHVVILSEDTEHNFKLIWRPASIRFETHADFYQVLADRGLDDSADYYP